MIIFYSRASLYKYFDDYIRSLRYQLEKLGESTSLILYENNLIHEPTKDKHVFIQSIPFCIQSKVFLLNTEQTTLPSVHETLKQVYKDKNIVLLDYSKENIINLPKDIFKQTFFIPYQVYPSEINNSVKDLDVCIIVCGEYGPPVYRLEIINQLKDKNINITLLSGWNEERDTILFRHKILLNIGWNENYKILEQIRCNRCIFNKMIVISDIKLDKEIHLSKHMIFSEYSKIADKTCEVLSNYNEIHSKLFQDFNLNEYEEYYKGYLKEWINA